MNDTDRLQKAMRALDIANKLASGGYSVGGLIKGAMPGLIADALREEYAALMSSLYPPEPRFKVGDIVKGSVGGLVGRVVEIRGVDCRLHSSEQWHNEHGLAKLTPADLETP